MGLEIDHVFVCTGPGAPEAERLLALGLVEGTANVHVGQGTANRRFFFANAMLELLWVRDEREARSRATMRTRLFERWNGRASGCCPFGICFRSTSREESPPFATWDYRPRYLSPPLRIGIGTNSERLDEPMLFHLPFGSRPDAAPAQSRQPIEHRLPVREITRVRWIGPTAASVSRELRDALSCGAFTAASGPSHALEIDFDGEARGEAAALAPDLPITLRW